MTTPVQFHRDGAARQIVLIDLDWDDADALPELLRQPGVSVRLVTGTSADDPGMRVAELCGVPRTTELADLTRQTFDLALVGEHSPRRRQLETLFQALGTPLTTPKAFMSSIQVVERRANHVELPAAPGRTDGVSGEELDALVDGAIPDVAPAGPEPAPRRAMSHHAVPPPDDGVGIERLLARWAQATGASCAELTLRREEGPAQITRIGGEDPLLAALGELAGRLDAPQIVSRVVAGEPGRLWGAWPLRGRVRGVLMVAGLRGADDLGACEQLLYELQAAWDRPPEERRGEAEGRPRGGWLTPAEFRGCVDLAIEAHRREGLRFTLHRLRLSAAADAIEALCRRLPHRLRATDCLCRPAPGSVLLLCGGGPAEFPNLRRRIDDLWLECCREAGASSAEPVGNERVELAHETDAPVFLAAADGWLAPR